MRLDPGPGVRHRHPSLHRAVPDLARRGTCARGASVIDYGCGSGVLAIAAARARCARVDAFDIDPQALIATRDNAAANDVADRVHVCRPQATAARPGQMSSLANILAGTLIELARSSPHCVRPGGHLVLAGILKQQVARSARRLRVRSPTLEVVRRERRLERARRRAAPGRAMSRMSTTCPNCPLHLAVTPADLRVGQGYVRCGRCERVFNALVSLAEDEDSGPALGRTTSPPAPRRCRRDRGTRSPAATELEEVTATAGAGAGDPSPPSDQRGLSRELARRARAAISGQTVDTDVVESVGTGTFETIVLEGSGATQTEEHVDAAVVRPASCSRLADRIEAGPTRRRHRRRGTGVEFTPVDETRGSCCASAGHAASGRGRGSGRRYPATTCRSRSRQPRRCTGAGSSPPRCSPWRFSGSWCITIRHSLIARSWAAPVIGPVYAAFGAPLEPRLGSRTPTTCASWAARHRPAPRTRSSCAPAC